MLEHNLTAFKPDFEDARKRWEAFWNGGMIDRPICMVKAPKSGVGSRVNTDYLDGFTNSLEIAVEKAMGWLGGVYWGGDAVPTYIPSFGPDQFAAFLGAELKWSPDSPFTNWAEPIIDDWEKSLPLGIYENNSAWTRMKEFMNMLVEASAGRMVVSHLDLHTNLDALSALRGPSRLCEDLLDSPDLIDKAMSSVSKLFIPVYEEFYKAGAMDRTGSSGWLPAYCEGRYNVIQCDAICLISPRMGRRWVIPALQEEAAYLDHCIYHLDGPGTIPHLDDILSIPEIDCIQWVPGDGQPPQLEWMDMLKRIQNAGKSIILHISPSDVKRVHKEFNPEKVIYDCYAGSEEEANELTDWLVRNT